LPKGFCRLTNIRTDEGTAWFELELPGDQPKNREEWKLHIVKKRIPMNKKLKRACVRLRVLLSSREIREGTIGIGGGKPNTLEIKFHEDTMQEVMLKVIIILNEELDK
jgi:hypothetical protein